MKINKVDWSSLFILKICNFIENLSLIKEKKIIQYVYEKIEQIKSASPTAKISPIKIVFINGDKWMDMCKLRQYTEMNDIEIYTMTNNLIKNGYLSMAGNTENIIGGGHYIDESQNGIKRLGVASSLEITGLTHRGFYLNQKGWLARPVYYLSNKFEDFSKNYNGLLKPFWILGSGGGIWFIINKIIH